jgi:hypothetical protein
MTEKEQATAQAKTGKARARTGNGKRKKQQQILRLALHASLRMTISWALNDFVGS